MAETQKEKKIDSSFNKALLAWEASEYSQHEKGKKWNYIALAIVIMSSVIAFLLGAWTFSLAIIAVALVYYLENRKDLRKLTILISKIGIKIGKREIPYSQIKGFWIVYSPPEVKKLYLRLMKNIQSELEIQLEDQDPVLLREVLVKHLKEIKGQGEPLSSAISRLFKI